MHVASAASSTSSSNQQSAISNQPPDIILPPAAGPQLPGPHCCWLEERCPLPLLEEAGSYLVGLQVGGALQRQTDEGEAIQRRTQALPGEL